MVTLMIGNHSVLILYYVRTFVSDLRQVCGFSPGTQISPTNKTDHHYINEIYSTRIILNIVTSSTHMLCC